MNCEKCKNRKATTFYADESGGRHALCAVCASLRSKSISVDAPEEPHKEEKTQFLPIPSLISMLDVPMLSPIASTGDAKCGVCSATLDEIKSGSVFCPECYSAFESSLFPPPLLNHDSLKLKKPYAISSRASKQKLLSELKDQLRAAIDSESFELAAELRDKIRSLDDKRRESQKSKI